MSMAKILMQVKLPGETVLSLKKETEKLSKEDKDTLIQWYYEEQRSMPAVHAK